MARPAGEQVLVGDQTTLGETNLALREDPSTSGQP
jgi:hypothetical protein